MMDICPPGICALRARVLPWTALGRQPSDFDLRPLPSVVSAHRFVADGQHGYGAIDLLHTFYLGALQDWAKSAVWHLLSSPVWHTRQTVECQRLKLSLACLKSELFEWYRSVAQSYPDVEITRVSDITMKMLGTKAKPRLKVKAAEALGVSNVFPRSIAYPREEDRRHRCGIATMWSTFDRHP